MAANPTQPATLRSLRPVDGRILTPPNLLSIGRLFLLIPLFMFLRQGKDGDGDLWAFVIMGVALLSDLLDGYIARVFRQESEWGRVLDPLADKTWLGCLALFLAMPWRANPLPWWFLGLVLLRDAVIVVGAYLIFKRNGEVVKSNWIGKIAMVAIAVTLIAYTADMEYPELPWLRPEFVMWIAACIVLASGIAYAERLRRYLTTPR